MSSLASSSTEAFAAEWFDNMSSCTWIWMGGRGGGIEVSFATADGTTMSIRVDDAPGEGT